MECLLDLTTLRWMLGTGVSEVPFGLMVASLVVAAALWWWWYVSVPNMPPGPLGLPLVGYLPWIDPKAPHLTLSKLVDRYGKVFSLKMGGIWVIVMADPKVVKDSFNLKSTTGRAPLYLTHGIMKGYGLICAEGWLWRDHRKFVAGFMRDQGMRAAVSRADMERRIQDVAKLLTKELSETEDPVDVSAKLLHHVGNTMNELIFGMTYAEEDPTWRWLRHLLEEGTKLVGVAGPMNFLPWLRFLPMYQRVIRFITENQEKTHQEYQKIVDAREMSLMGHSENDNKEVDGVQRHDGTLNPAKRTDKECLEEQELCDPLPLGDSDSQNIIIVKKSSSLTMENDSASREEGTDKSVSQEIPKSVRRIEDLIPRNVIEAYIKERSQRGDDVGSFTYEQLHHVAADLFGAGSETTITTLRWHLLNMALFPEVQTRVQKELDGFAAGSDHVTLDESSLMSFTQASIMETQRLRSIVPLGVPHGASEALKIEGYNIPSGSMLLPLLWFIHHDPDTWKDPDQYIPERFLDEDGKLLRQHPAFMPFQTGRRMCIGDEFAKMILFVFSTRILLKFKVGLENKDPWEDPTKDPICGISLCPRPFKLVFIPRIEM